MILLKKIKSAIFRHFELCYWYRLRKIKELYFDDEDAKWKNSLHKTKAKNILASTWNGEDDLWRTMLLKIDHEFWNLHKDGFELNYYFSKHDIEKYASDDDKKFIVQKILDSTLGNNKKLWIFNGKTDKKTSESGLVHFYLVYKNGSDLLLTCESDKEIPQKLIPKNKRLYEIKTFKDANGKLQFEKKESPRYELKSQETIIDLGKVEKENLTEKILNEDSDFLKNDFEKFLSEHSEINVEPDKIFSLQNFILEQIDKCNGFKIEELPNLSAELKKHARGNFIKCRDLLRLRHLIKNLLSLSETDDKYFSLRSDIEDETEMQKKREELRNLYKKDRKSAYQKICDFMCEKGELWWD